MQVMQNKSSESFLQWCYRDSICQCLSHYHTGCCVLVYSLNQKIILDAISGILGAVWNRNIYDIRMEMEIDIHRIFFLSTREPKDNFAISGLPSINLMPFFPLGQVPHQKPHKSFWRLAQINLLNCLRCN